MLMLCLTVAGTNTSQAQSTDPPPPIDFIYGGDMKAKNEGGKNYIYIYCNQFRGTTCTRPDAAMRVEVPKVGGFLKAIFPGG